MNKKTVILLISLTLIGVGYLLWLNQNKPEQIKNSQMLESQNNTPIITENEVNYFENTKGYLAQPKAPGNYPGIVMIHENRGLRPEIKSTADQLAKEGYIVLAVDLFQGQVVEEQTQARALTSSFNQEIGTKNLQAAVAYVKEKGATKVASLGWCFGGKQSIELAVSGTPLDATVVYYGGGLATSTERLAPIKWPVLGIFGDQDQVIPVETVEVFETSLNTLGVKNEIYMYPGVGHAFANPSGMNYAPEPTKDAWSKTLAFLQSNLK